MTALSNGTTTNDPETIHISLPGRFNLRGQQKPAALIDAEIESEKAWKEYEKSIDQAQAGTITQERLAELFNRAVICETNFRNLLADWNHSFVLSIN